jgi:acyl-coenzyme A synthetase/AMP-(fatty) acid ligase
LLFRRLFDIRESGQYGWDKGRRFEKVQRKKGVFPASGGELCVLCPRRVVESRIPGYMLPNCVIHMEELPRNANGKVDRRRLEEMWT